MAWNEYVDVFTFILRQFWVSREIKIWVVQMLFEATEIVPSTHATIQVTSALIEMFPEKI